MLRPLPFAQPDRLAMLWEDNEEKGWSQQTAAPANLLDWQEQVRSFNGVAGYQDFFEESSLETPTGPRVLDAVAVTGGFFDVLGIRAALGTTFTESETWASGKRVVIVSDQTWRQHLGSDPNIVGRTVTLDGRQVQVVGVMPSGFTYPTTNMDLWYPTAWDPADRGQTWFRRAHWMRPFARLRDGVTFEEARTELQTVMGRLETQYPETNTHMQAGLGPLHDFLVGPTRTPLLVLLGATAFLLLIACANIGNLLLVRAASREREVVLRRALGAGRGRIARQTLTESFVLSLLGGAAGLALGWWGTRALVALQPAGLLPVADVRPDLRVFTFVLVLSTLSALLFGLAPALWSARRNAVDVLKDSGRTSSESRRMRRWGNALAIGEVALALMLTVGAGLLLRSFWHLTRVEPGFESRGVLAVSLAFHPGRYQELAGVTGFLQQLRARVGGLHGVDGAALSSRLPLSKNTGWTSDFAVRGQPISKTSREIMHREVGPGYFHTMRVPLVSGRDFTGNDRAGAEWVTIINQAMADQHFRGRDPVGEMIAFDREPDSTSIWHRIVGVAGSEHQKSLGEPPRPEVFTALEQTPRRGVHVVIRTATDPQLLVPAVEGVISELDPGMPVLAAVTMDDAKSRSLARERFLATLLLAFASVGALLSIVGVYGVVAQLALRRTNEMNIRIALGAQAAQVRWLVVRHGLTLVGAGVVTGCILSAAFGGAVRTLLYGVGPLDPFTFVVMPACLLLTGLAASWIPAVRATRTDPAGALRSE
jgi:putative ABC transport system permease protein